MQLDPVVEFDHFFFRYGDNGPFALKDVSLRIDQGAVVFIGGPSGAGKTTLCNAIAGLIPFKITGQMKGNVRLLGKNMVDYTSSELAGLIGFVFQNADEQLVTFTVFDEIAFAVENLQIPREEIQERIHVIAQQLHIEHLLSRSVSSLSGGEKQKVIIAANLVMLPRILILDEPTAFLDVHAEKMLIDTLQELHQADPSMTIVIVDHRLSPFESMIDAIVLLDKAGRVEFSGTFDAYKNRISRNVEDVIRSEIIYPDFESFLVEVNQSRPIDGSNISAESPIIELRDVSYAYPGGSSVFDHLSLTIQEGEFIGLTGENGSGKTTMLYLMAGVLTPDEGIIALDGVPVNQLQQKSIYSKYGFIFQNPENQIFESTVADEILYGPRNFFPGFNNRPQQFKDDLVTQHVALIDDARLSTPEITRKNPFRLSWGQKRRLNLGSILSYDPDIILLDEPFIGQDKAAVDRIFAILHDANEHGKTIVLVSHDLDLVRQHCSRVIYLDHEKQDLVAKGETSPVIVEAYSSNDVHAAKPKQHRKNTRKHTKLDDFLARNFNPAFDKPSTSRVHPLAKLAAIIALTVLVFFQQSLLVLGIIYIITFLVAWRVQGNAKDLLRQLRIVLLFTLVYVPLNALFDATARPGEQVFFYLLPPYFPIRHVAFYVSIRAGIILMTLFTSTVAFNRTTPLKDFIYAMMQIRVPYRFAFAFMAGLRYIPMVRNEASTIEIAQRLRGGGISKKSNVRAVFRHLVHRISTLLINIFRKVYTTASAMDVRGFGAYTTRTSIFMVPWKKRDFMMLGAAIILGTFGILLGFGVFVGFRIPSVVSLLRMLLMT
jgi:energy-coupling factor transport system ATP-binding protein